MLLVLLSPCLLWRPCVAISRCCLPNHIGHISNLDRHHHVVQDAFGAQGPTLRKMTEVAFLLVLAILLQSSSTLKMLPGVMEALDLNDFYGDNVRDLKSCSWFRRYGDERLLDYFAARIPLEALLGF